MSKNTNVLKTPLSTNGVVVSVEKSPPVIHEQRVVGTDILWSPARYGKTYCKVIRSVLY